MSRGIKDILETGAAWITETELAWLGAELDRLTRAADPAAARIRALEAEVEWLKDHVENLLHRMTSEEAATEIERLRLEVEDWKRQHAQARSIVLGLGLGKP